MANLEIIFVAWPFQMRCEHQRAITLFSGVLHFVVQRAWLFLPHTFCKIFLIAKIFISRLLRGLFISATTVGIPRIFPATAPGNSIRRQYITFGFLLLAARIIAKTWRMTPKKGILDANLKHETISTSGTILSIISPFFSPPARKPLYFSGKDGLPYRQSVSTRHPPPCVQPQTSLSLIISP